MITEALGIFIPRTRGVSEPWEWRDVKSKSADQNPQACDGRTTNRAASEYTKNGEGQSNLSEECDGARGAGVPGNGQKLQAMTSQEASRIQYLHQ